jgi:hypothetical protein
MTSRRDVAAWLTDARAMAQVRLWLSTSEGYTRHYIRCRSPKSHGGRNRPDYPRRARCSA